MLSLESAIIQRISQQVVGFTIVANPSVLAGLRDIGPLLPACIIVPGPGEPVSTNQDSLPLQEQQEWDVVIIVQHQHDSIDDGQTEIIASRFMNGVLKALYGWKGGDNQRKGFVYVGRQAPNYSLGYAEFQMTFAANFVVGG